MVDFDKLKRAIGDLDEETALGMLREVVNAGGDGAQEAMDACQQGMTIVGDNFESGEYYVSDLIFAGELMMNAVELLSPMLLKESGEKSGRMILCTVKNDLHDIGKNIVKSVLVAAGIDVIDLGIDVPAEVIVEKAKADGIRVIGLSCVLTVAIDSMKATVEAFKKAGLRENVKIIIGGAPITEAVCEQVGADAWSLSPQKAAGICREWLAAV